MNTADRSIRAIDIAIRRRFDIFECPPDLEALQRYYDTRENRVDSLVDGLGTLNAELMRGVNYFRRRVASFENATR